MEKSPTPTAPKNELQADEPFDFSKYTQPAAVEVPADAPTGESFDFSKFQDGQNRPKTFEEVSQEISEEARLTQRFDFSDENIASGGPILRDATPTEIHEQAELDQQVEQAQRKKKFGSKIVPTLFRRG